MSNPWDYEARQRLEHKGRGTASWFAWCDRNGFTEQNTEWYPIGRRYWSREHFKMALDLMPKDHPDRWKYETGKRYAPTHFASSRWYLEYLWILLAYIPTMTAILFAWIYVLHAYWVHATVCLVAITVPWSIWLWFRYKALRK